MLLRDNVGNFVTGATPTSLDHFQHAVRLLQCYVGDPVAVVDQAISASPEMVMAHALKAWLHLLGTEPNGSPVAREALRTALRLPANHREAGHLRAISCLVEGRWMRGNPDAWSRDSFFCVHNWWHLALFHLDLGQTDAALALFDGPIYGKRSPVVLDMVDASALLWRLQLRGIDVGNRWAALADNWEPIAGAGNYAFNDAHAIMAFLGAGRPHAAVTVLETQATALERDDDNAMFTREVGRPVVLGIKAFAEGNYAETVRLLRPVRDIANRFGGSHAQRDLLDLTLIEAACRAGQTALSAALAAERADAKPTSPWSRALRDRCTSKAA